MRLRAAFLGALLVLGPPAGVARAAVSFEALRGEAAVARDAKTVAALTRRFAGAVAGLGDDAEPGALQTAADAYGALVAAARATEGAAASLAGLLASAASIAERVERSRDRLEDATNEDERALEALYGSRAWRRLDFIDLLLRYWGAWAELAQAQRAPAGDERTTLLRAAERGFARTRLEPELPQATQSLLGLALVQRLRGDGDGARRTLEKLDAELAARGDPELLAASLLERAAIAFDEGDLEAARVYLARLPEGTLGEEQSLDLVELEARAWLSRAAEGGGGVEEAARLLRQLDAAGGERARRVAALVAEHRELLAAYEIGPTGSLLLAEQAFAASRFAEASAAYGRALAHADRLAGADLPVVRFKYAVALYESDAPPARTLAVLETLLADEGAGPVRRQAAALYYTLSSRGSDETRTLRAARRLLAIDPAAPAADHARYRLATAAGSGAAEREAWLAQVMPESDSHPNALLERVRLETGKLVERDGAAPDPETITLARELLSDLERVDSLVAEGRLAPDPERDAVHAAWGARAAALAGAPPADVLARIDAAFALPALGKETRRSLLRLRLVTLAGSADYAGLTASLAAASEEALRADWDLWHETLRALEKAAEPAPPGAFILAFYARLAPLAPKPYRADAELGYASALLREGQAREAAERSGRLIARDPTWADARWLHARALDAFDPGAASQAWQEIARGLASDSAPWLDAQLARARSARSADRPAEACQAAAEVREARPDAAREPLRGKLDRAAGACPKADPADPSG